MKTFEARFDGICAAECARRRIHVGDHVTYTDDGLVHAECEVPYNDEAKVKTCPKCWLVHRGECF